MHDRTGGNYFIYPTLDLCRFVRRKVAVKMVVALRLLLLYVRAEGPSAVEHPHHRLVEDVLRRMHPGIVIFAHGLGTNGTDFPDTIQPPAVQFRFLDSELISL